MSRLAWQVYALDADLTNTGVIWSRTGAKQTCVLCPERPPPTMQFGSLALGSPAPSLAGGRSTSLSARLACAGRATTTGSRRT